jgi:GntR family transcriptional regulator
MVLEATGSAEGELRSSLWNAQTVRAVGGCERYDPVVPLDQLVHGATLMDITIDIDSPVPQFEQLIEQVKAAVTAGVLKAGDALPSIRQLANDLELNSKTVAKAYKLLERDSVIETKGYRGTYVHPRAKANCKINLQEWTLRRLGETVAELREAGVTDSEIRNAFADAISRQPRAK